MLFYLYRFYFFIYVILYKIYRNGCGFILTYNQKTSFEKKYKFKLVILWVVTITCFIVSFSIGRYPISPIDLIKVIINKIIPLKQTWAPEVETVIFQVRLPRVLSALLIGASLSCAGASYQGLFRNPMVSPNVLGASAGAAFGAALGIFFSFGYFGISLSAFVFGIFTVFVVYSISKRVKSNPILGLVLTGIMIGSLFSSATSFIKLVADPQNVLPAITYWLMGSLASIRQKDLMFVSIPIFIGLVPLFLLRWKMNLLAMGEEEAQTMGINTKRLRFIIILCATLVTAASVSVSGMIGWVGLVIPHFARLLTGYDYRLVMPVSILLGGSYLMMVDNIARIISTSEVPIGILTAFVGAPFFVYLILREGKQI